MDAVWYGIAHLFEWIFAAAKPMGRMVNAFFIIVGFVGTFYWLFYGEQVRKGKKNYLADND
ncbi:MAG: hypothetical protein ACKOYC_04885 [Bacteroidota bacterium]